uniref:LysR substrate-binding domain-containing protein n=3 Tax=Diaphorobacter TaxID=238749 RepID=UPI0028B04ADE
IAGLGVAVVQRALVEPELAAGRIAIAIDHPVLLDRGYHLCIPTGRAPNPALDDLRGWLLAQACGQGGG